MPTYTYECDKCGHSFDVFHSMMDKPKVRCESCKSTRCTKQLGSGAGIIFKGSGFYETDYREKKGKPPSDEKTESKGKGNGKESSKESSKESGKESGAKDKPKKTEKSAAAKKD